MTTITTRSGKGSPLTNNEVDANFTNLNDDKVEASGDSMTGNLSFGDNNKAIFGAGSDLQIYHDGSNSIINDGGTGDLEVQANRFVVQSASGADNFLIVTPSGGVDLRHNVSGTVGTKLATTATGIDVTGRTTTDNATVGSGTASTYVDLTVNGASTANYGPMIELQSAGTAFGKISNYGRIQGGTSTDMFVTTATANNLLLGTNNAERMRITSAGDVEVKGGNELRVYRTDNATYGSMEYLTGAGGLKLRDVNGDGMTFAGASSDYMRIDSSGLVGIGNSSASSFTGASAQNLVVGSGSGHAGMTVYSGTTSVGGLAFADGTSAGSHYRGLVQYRHSEDAMLLYTSETERMRIDSTGIDVTGTVTADDMVISDGSPTLTFYETDTTNLNARFDNGGGDLYIQTVHDDGSNAKTRILIDHSDGDISFYNSAGSSQDLYWDASESRLGLGTTSPSTYDSRANNLVVGNSGDAGITIFSGASNNARLQFAPSGDTGLNNGLIGYDNANDKMSFATAGTDRMYINSSGNVGIGTQSPNQLLTLGSSTGTATIGLDFETTNVSRGSILYNAAAGEMAFTSGYSGYGGYMTFDCNGSERMRIDSSGNVKVKTGDLQIGESQANSGSGRYVDIYNQGTDSATFSILRLIRQQAASTSLTTSEFYARKNGETTLWNFETSSSAYLRAGIANTEGWRIDSSGNVGIGQSSPSSYYAKDLVVGGGSAEEGITIRGSSSGRSYLMFADGVSGNEQYRGYLSYNHANDMLEFASGATAHMYLDSSGNLLVGPSSNLGTGSEGVEIRGDYGGIITARNTASTAGHHTFINSNGTVGLISTTGTSTNYGQSSDQRLKDNIVDAPSASDDIDAIQIRSFDWKADGSHQKYGMVAQELQTVAPEAVSGDADSDEMMAVDYSKLVPMLVKEIQSLRARVAQLEGAN